MKKLLVALGIMLLLVGCCRYATITNRPPISDSALASLIVDYNVGIKRPGKVGKCGGTLVGVNGNLRMLTARHCIQSCTIPAPTMCVGPTVNEVTVLDGGKEYKATLVRTSDKYDLALYKVESDSVVAIANIAKRRPLVGDTVITAGCPRGVCDALSWGRVSKHNVKERISVRQLMQLDVNLTTGASGSGVFNDRGSLVGVIVAGLDGLFAVAVPLEGVREFLSE